MNVKYIACALPMLFSIEVVSIICLCAMCLCLLSDMMKSVS